MPNRERALGYTAPALLVAVALLQQALVPSVGLSPWKGGGFGMFATVDDPRTRGLRMWADLDGEIVPLDLRLIPQDSTRLRRAFTRARYMPSRRSLQTAAEGVAQLEWILADTEDPPRLAPVGEGDARSGAVRLSDPGVALRVEVLAHGLDGPPWAMSYRTRASHQTRP